MCKLRNVKETNWQTNWFSYHKYIFCRATSNLCKPITWSIKRPSQTTNSCTFGRKFLENLFIWNPTTLLPIPPFLFPVHIHIPVLFNYFNKELFKETYSNHRRPSQNEFNKFYDNHVQNIWIKILIFISNTLFPGFQY